MPSSDTITFSPGQRLLIRDAEWCVKRVDLTHAGHAALSVTGVSEIVRGKEAVFLSAAEEKIEVLDPAETKLVGDDSAGFLRTRLHLESQLRRTPPIGTDLFIGHRAAMDLLPFQLKPAAQALAQPRQRILIADTVGLGKTLEAGILVAELVRRGRARRILVVTQKSLLAQFQKEFWSRFTIPLVRLDSIGLQRVRNRIPTHANPFYYYDRSIISIDTLKQDNEFRHHLEQAYWDVIVIDEAHNVAKRGTSAMRHRLAELLSSRSDTLIMLSATPHDGRKASFASLMNMLDPTAIADPENYSKEDIGGLYVRRFRNEVVDELRHGAPERKMIELRTTGSDEEELVFELLDKLELSTEDGGKRKATGLFRTTLLKGFLSSPDACIETINNRIKNVEAGRQHGTLEDKTKLETILAALAKINESSFSKYQKLLHHLKTWKPAANDRLVIFTERIATLTYLQERLPAALKLKPNQVQRLDGNMDDIAMMDAVEAFGQEECQVRLLLASDVASEGINLHHQCHRLIHFDVPWSLMVFAQRNGRIDRYGQRHQPELAYLLTCSKKVKRTDERVLELLLEKDKEAQESIGDPSALLGKYTKEDQEQQVEEALETGDTRVFETKFGELNADDFELFLKPASTTGEVKKGELPSLFVNEYDYCSSSLSYLQSSGEPLQFQKDDRRQELFLTIHKDSDTDDLASRFHFLPSEILPEKGQLHLTIHTKEVQEAMETARNKKREDGSGENWPQTQYLWPLHPVLEWIDDRVQAAFGRHEAPVVFAPGLRPNEALVLVSGIIPNRLGHPLVLRWVGVLFREGKPVKNLDLNESLDLCGLRNKDLVNQTAAGLDRCKNLQALLPLALTEAKVIFDKARKETLEQNHAKLEEQEKRLAELLARHDAQLELAFMSGIQQVNQKRKEDRRQQVRRDFESYKQWLDDVHNIEEHAHFTILAVCTGA
jgi:superfamily II DNA or RNA helicase